jgi:hypothetical protein
MPNVMLKLLDYEFLIAHDARDQVADRYDADHSLLLDAPDTTCLPVACRVSALLSLSRSALHGNRMFRRHGRPRHPPAPITSMCTDGPTASRLPLAWRQMVEDTRNAWKGMTSPHERNLIRSCERGCARRAVVDRPTICVQFLGRSMHTVSPISGKCQAATDTSAPGPGSPVDRRGPWVFSAVLTGRHRRTSPSCGGFFGGFFLPVAR